MGFEGLAVGGSGRGWAGDEWSIETRTSNAIINLLVGFERRGSEAAVDRSWRGWAGDEWSIETRTSNAIINLFVGFERRGSEAAVDRSWRGWAVLAGGEKLLKCRRPGSGRGADAPFKGPWGIDPVLALISVEHVACWRYGTREAVEMLAACFVLNRESWL